MFIPTVVMLWSKAENTTEYVAGIAIAVLILAYLLFALIKPEKL